MDSERRKYVRYFPEGNTFAALRSGFNKVGKVDDISIKGLGFSYLREATGGNPTDHSSKVDIFISGNGFHLSNVPCEIVYDLTTSIPKEGLFIKVSRCGLHFEDLTKSQLEKLEFLLKNHMKGV